MKIALFLPHLRHARIRGGAVGGGPENDFFCLQRISQRAVQAPWVELLFEGSVPLFLRKHITTFCSTILVKCSNRPRVFLPIF